jgi:hypothetical protein
MTYYKKSSPVPWIAGIVLLAVFVAIVIHYSGDDQEQDPNMPPLARGGPAPAPIPVPEPEPVPMPPPVDEPYEPPPPPKPKLSAAEAEKRLRDATKEWRAFTVRLSQRERWKSAKAVAFLQKVTWNDRDLEKQHSNGLRSIGLMLGMPTTDTVALAEELTSRGSLTAFFEQNWSKVDVADEPSEEPKETVLEDAWKPNRIRWGFPLDTPVETLRQFKNSALAVTLRVWPQMAGIYVQSLEIDETEKAPKFAAAIGRGANVKTREAKMHAAFRILMDKPDGSVREVAEEFFNRIQGKKDKELQEYLQSLLENRPKVAKAVKAAEAAG